MRIRTGQSKSTVVRLLALTGGWLLAQGVLVQSALAQSALAQSAIAQGGGVGGGGGAPIGSSQTGSVQDVLPNDSEPVVEQLLLDLKLDNVLASQLRDRIATAKPEARVRSAEMLGRLYVRMLGATTDSQQRKQLERLSQELLEQVPEADSSELRLDMCKATYLQAEEAAEKWRLRLATPEERSESLRVLQDVLPTFTQIRAKLQRRVDALEQREKSIPQGGDEAGVRAELGDARRLRSIAAYYEGWSRYYLAYLGNDKSKAKDALEAFGVLLNAVPGKVPSVERFPSSNLRLDHVARSVFGAALSNSLLGNEVDAMRWLDVMIASDELSTGVSSQIFSRQFMVLVQANRWSDVESLVRRRRLNGRDGAIQPLSAQEARLVAISSLDALRGGQLREGLKVSVGMVSRAALGDLVSQGELAQIVDLVKQYGTLPIGDDGFIVAYVRGLQAYEKASALQVAARATGAGESKSSTQNKLNSESKSSAETPGGVGGPETDPAVVNAFREAAQLVEAALKADDIGQFETEQARAHLRRGLALFYAGDLLPASAAFERAFEAGKDARVREDALWYAVVALDMLVERGEATRTAQRDGLATLFVQQFPQSPNATRLLIRQAQVAGVDDRKAMEILLAVPQDSPLYLAARRHAARLLYQQYRGALASERQFLALRFADVAEELMRLEMPQAMSASDDSSRLAAESIVLRSRQLLDVLLTTATPDLPRAEAAFITIDQLASRHGVSTQQFEAELLFRRLQMLIARGMNEEAQKIWDKLRGLKGPFADAADQWMYRLADEAWRREEQNASKARDLVRFGAAWLERLPEGDTRTVVRDRVAHSSAFLWKVEQDKRMRELAIKLDREQAASGLSTVTSLRRLAQLLEDASDAGGALEAWTQLLGSMEPGTADWYEPRFHTLRLLQKSDLTGARQAYTQHKLLYPQTGPDPFGPKIEQLGLVVIEQAKGSSSESGHGSGGNSKGGGK